MTSQTRRSADPRCTLCNWSSHPASAHGVPLCRKGHPMTEANTYLSCGRGRCRACHNANVRAYRNRNLEAERARWRAWAARQRDAVAV